MKKIDIELRCKSISISHSSNELFVLLNGVHLDAFINAIKGLGKNGIVIKVLMSQQEVI